MAIQRAVVLSSADSLRRVVADHEHLPGRTSAVLEGNERYFLTTLTQLRRLTDDDDDDRERLLRRLHGHGRYVQAVDKAELAAIVGNRPTIVLADGRVTGVERFRASRPTSAKQSRTGRRAKPPEALSGALPAAEDASGGDTGEFRAYAAVDSPRGVRSGETFSVTVGFTLDGDLADMVVDPNAPPVVVFEVQAVGFGLSFPDGVRRTLKVPRADPTRASTTFTVTAQDVAQDSDATLVISFARRGVSCGHAVRLVRVHVGEVPASELEPETTPAGGAVVSEAAQATAADLTVHILVGDTKLHWIISTGHRGVRLPLKEVLTDLPEESARAFAQSMLEDLNDGSGPDEIWHRVRVMGEMVAKLVAPEFWDAVEDVWGQVRRRTPTLLILTDEPYLPWELMWVSTDNVRPDDLYPPELPSAPLSMLWHVGRWPSGVKEAKYVDPRPPCPPEGTLEVTGMVVVTGGYAPGARGLPEATEESADLEKAYDAVQLSDEAGLLRVLNNEVTDSAGNPVRPSVVHIAMHGLADDATRPLDARLRPASGRGVDVIDFSDRKLSEEVHPLVFLNACQVGAAGQSLNRYTGIPEALLSDGCRSCIAPLWTVDDATARRFAVEFYRRALTKRQPVGRVLTDLRRDLHADAAMDTITPLAYVYYGHPDLKLTR